MLIYFFVMACVAYGCGSHSSNNSVVSYHRFPVDIKTRRQWINALRRTHWKPTKYSRLCSKHFASDCYILGSKRKKLRTDAVPTKFGIFSQMREGDVNHSTEDGQEEWLSEGLLTDDEQMEQDRSLGETETVKKVADGQMHSKFKDIKIKPPVGLRANMKATIEELDEFISQDDNEIRISCVQTGAGDESDRNPSSAKASDDNSNDTDYLLRMLGGDDDKNAKNGGSSDEEALEAVQLKTLLVAKNAVVRKRGDKKRLVKARADSDCSSDEDDSKVVRSNKKENSWLKVEASRNGTNKANGGTQDVDSLVKTKRTGDRHSSLNNVGSNKISVRCKNGGIPMTTNDMDDSNEEDFHEAEYLEDDDFNLDDNMDGLTRMPEAVQHRRDAAQVMRRPEVMDEEIPSDADTEQSNFSDYDDLPSSESEDIGDWFALDLRNERAGDYVQLLGTKAVELLNVEKKQVSTKLTSLRSKLEEVSKKSFVQSSDLEACRQRIMEMDELLSHY